jgi:hypothetical protein
MWAGRSQPDACLAVVVGNIVTIQTGRARAKSAQARLVWFCYGPTARLTVLIDSVPSPRVTL